MCLPKPPLFLWSVPLATSSTGSSSWARGVAIVAAIAAAAAYARVGQRLPSGVIAPAWLALAIEVLVSGEWRLPALPRSAHVVCGLKNMLLSATHLDAAVLAVPKDTAFHAAFGLSSGFFGPGPRANTVVGRIAIISRREIEGRGHFAARLLP